MRPIDKGAAPAVYAHYRDATADLMNRLGDYCSYCERQIETHLAVEHVQPKSLAAALINEWSNFLLGCVNCNSCKSDTAVAVVDYLWPDLDNTLRAVQYSSGGLVEPHPAAPEVIREKALAIIRLVGLDRFPGNDGIPPTSSDRRWLKRKEMWVIAERDRARLVENNSIQVRELIVENAVARGMFSIWWTVFEGDTDMRRRFREAFTGTDAPCFDADEACLARAGGQV